jgi:hypothetical protein
MLNILTGILGDRGAVIFGTGTSPGKGPGAVVSDGLDIRYRVVEKMTVFEKIMVGGIYGDSLTKDRPKNQSRRVIDMIGLSTREKKWFAGK